MVNFRTWMSDCNSHSPALLDFFLSSDVSIHSTMASSPLGNSDYADVSVSIGFPTNSKWEAPFHCIFYDYLRADLDSLWLFERCSMGGYLLKSVFLLQLVNFVTGFRLELMLEYIPHQKNQAKSHSFSCFSAPRAAAIVHRNHFSFVPI